MRELPTWELLAKKMIWQQLGNIKQKKILDFGSGEGVTASYYANDNDVIAVEPSEESVLNRDMENEYTQLLGSMDKLKEMEDASFDLILCHNVLEYAEDREKILKEFDRLLKPNGSISIVKHNRPGRVMQMVVLLNNFESANSLLDGHDSNAEKYGAIRYYEDSDVTRWCPELKIKEVHGVRTFWDLQQNQEIQKDEKWQEEVLQIESRVADIKEYRDIAFFHHLILEKKQQK